MTQIPDDPLGPPTLDTPPKRELPTSSGAPSVPEDVPTGTLSGLGLCCACPFDDKISTNGSGTYYTAGYPHSNLLTNAAKLAITRTKTAGTVRITKTFALTYANGATATADAGGITSALIAGANAWTRGASAYKVEIKQPGCEVQLLSISFGATVVASGADVDVTVDGTPDIYARSYVVGGTAMTFYTAPPEADWTMAHELGHCYGQPDEYTTITGTKMIGGPPPAVPTLLVPKVSPTMVYHGTPAQGGDVKVVLTHNPGFVPAPGDTSFDFWFDEAAIMGEYASYHFPRRNFHWIAIEVKRILEKQVGGCDVRIV